MKTVKSKFLTTCSLVFPQIRCLCKSIFVTIGVCTLLLIGDLSAQDIHFSQFYNSPLSLNPALTGKINGGYRVNVIYRNQWFGVVESHSPYVTPAASFDKPFAFRKDAFGVGLILLNDKTGDNRLNSLLALASGAYHKSLGKNHSLSLGLQIGLIQKRIDADNLEWGSQFKDDHFNHNLPSGEEIENSTSTSADLNAGFLWNGKLSEKVMAYAGFSGFHLNQPKITFLVDSDERIDSRFMIHAGADIELSEKILLIPSFVYTSVRNLSEVNVGTAFGFDITRHTGFFLGGYYRVNDAAIAFSAVEWRNTRVGLSYDFTVTGLSDARDATHRPTGSIEVSLQYVGKVIPMPGMKQVLFCPRF